MATDMGNNQPCGFHLLRTRTVSRTFDPGLGQVLFLISVCFSVSLLRGGILFFLLWDVIGSIIADENNDSRKSN